MREFFKASFAEIFVLYGLAFVVLGVAVFALPRQEGKSRSILHLPLLAAFGLTHGTLEFIVLWKMQHQASSVMLDWSIALLLFASFLPLFEFGRRTLWGGTSGPFGMSEGQSASWLYAALILATLSVSQAADNALAGFVSATRFFLGFPAALLAGFALWGRGQIEQEHSRSLHNALRIAAAGFLAYAILTIVLPSNDPGLPAMFMTEEQFLNFFGIPVQALRALCAVIVATAVVHIVRRMNHESRSREIAQVREIEYANAMLTQEIEQRRQFEEQLKVMAVAFETQEAVMITDASSVILRVNQAFTANTGYAVEEAVGQTPRLLKSGRHNADLYREMWETIHRTGTWQGEIWDRCKNGEVFPKWLTISAVKDDNGDITHYVGSYIDITERKAAEEEIKNLAFYDSLTHLPNRRLLLDRFKQALASSARSGRKGALLFIDLDNFKNLNDTLGHEIGDLLLQQVAQHLESCVREGDTVARLGGDEFVVMLEDLSEQDLEAAAQTEIVGMKILATLTQPYQLATYKYRSTASVGATLFSGNQSKIDELFKQADIAMYQAKKAGRNTLRFFDPAMQALITARVTMESDLRRAVSEQEQLLLYYQAQVDASGRLTGAEALVRWQHPERGMISPAEFIPLAEESGLILPLGHWVLTTACRQLAAWATQPETAHLTVAVNVSAKQFHLATFVEEVLALVDYFEVDPAKLKLEITESLLLDNVDDIIAKMTALKARGISFAMDDFGTGYSSLSHLKRLPLYQLKIDQSFVRDVLTDSNDAAISKMIVSLAESMNLEVIAEGVETEAQREFLNLNGCHSFQGYLFGKPVPIGQFEALLKPA